METNHFPQISIPKPCHEDWGKMTPDQRGAFCSVCSKSVWDFTTKTPEEIKTILVQESGKKMCGRFRPDQLAQPVDLVVPVYLFKEARLPRLTQFAIAALVVFGTTLFSVTPVEGQLVGKMMVVERPRDMMVGEIADPRMVADTASDEIVPAVPEIGDTTNTANDPPKCTVKGNMRVPNYDRSIRGEIIWDTPPPTLPPDTEEVVMGDTIVVPPPPVIQEMVGIMVVAENPVEPEVIDTNILSLPIAGEMVIELPPLVSFDPVRIEPEVLVLENESATGYSSPDPVNPTDASGSLKAVGTFTVWPNPTSGVLNLSYSIPAQTRINIEVYDLQGQLLQRLTTAEQHEQGNYTRTFDVSALPSGTYLCVVKGEGVKEVVRFVKQ